jgi:hypothetical protein
MTKNRYLASSPFVPWAGTTLRSVASLVLDGLDSISSSPGELGFKSRILACSVARLTEAAWNVPGNLLMAFSDVRDT